MPERPREAWTSVSRTTLILDWLLLPLSILVWGDDYRWRGPLWICRRCVFGVALRLLRTERN